MAPWTRLQEIVTMHSHVADALNGPIGCIFIGLCAEHWAREFVISRPICRIFSSPEFQLTDSTPSRPIRYTYSSLWHQWHICKLILVHPITGGKKSKCGDTNHFVNPPLSSHPASCSNNNWTYVWLVAQISQNFSRNVAGEISFPQIESGKLWRGGKHSTHL